VRHQWNILSCALISNPQPLRASRLICARVRAAPCSRLQAVHLEKGINPSQKFQTLFRSSSRRSLAQWFCFPIGVPRRPRQFSCSHVPMFPLGFPGASSLVFPCSQWVFPVAIFRVFPVVPMFPSKFPVKSQAHNISFRKNDLKVLQTHRSKNLVHKNDVYI
jgi:hypothetical protein